MTTRPARWLAPLLMVLAAVPALAAGTRDLLLAARAGDLAAVQRLIGEGLPVDAADDWGTTPLYLAVKEGKVEVVRYLLEKGADPSGGETFFNTTILDVSLWGGEPDYAITKLLLAAGARNRANALGHALETGNVALARAAVESGPVRESEAAEIRRRYGEPEGEMAAVLSDMKTEKDPPPPAYTAAELAGFAGRFAGGEREATVAVQDGALVIDIDGTRTVLAAAAERMFRDEESGVVVRYYGRAGTVERIFVHRAGDDPVRLDLVSDDAVAVAADLPEFVADPNAKPTVNWPGFRGENRSGVGDGLDTPIDFDLESGRGVAWSVEVPGLANSSPVVWGNRVYVTTAVAAGGSTPLRTGLTGAGDEVEEAVEHRWLVLAYDKATGNKIWETEVGRGVPLTKRHFKATQANSSPATDGEHVVVVFPTAGLACLGTDGSLHWKRDLGGLNAGGFNDPGLQWGFAASPIIHRGKVILQVDIHDGPYLAAWDLKTGAERWRTPRPDVAPSWSTPAIWPAPAGEELVANASVIRGYDPDTGRELWSLGPTSIQVVASPVIGEKNLFVSSGYPPARPVYAVKPGIRGVHTIRSEDDAGPLAWYRDNGGAYMPTPLLYRGLLYIVHHNARLVAHDVRNGEPVLKARFSAGGTMTSSPVAANGRIYQGSEEGTLYVLEAGPSYRELAVHEFREPLMATPAISEGLLLVRTPSRLIAIGEPGKRAAAGGS